VVVARAELRAGCTETVVVAEEGMATDLAVVVVAVAVMACPPQVVRVQVAVLDSRRLPVLRLFLPITASAA
jgi:hypothetical protein